MTIDMMQIHNLIRTYQRAFQNSGPSRLEQPAADYAVNDDRVSLSAEARRHGEQHHAPQGMTLKSHR
jgi:hypothetical protein